MPNLSLAIKERQKTSGNTVALVQKTTPDYIDSIEVLAIRESGMQITDDRQSAFAHVQRGVYYDELSGRSFLDDADYQNVLGEYDVVFFSLDNLQVVDYASLAAGLFHKSVSGVIVNKSQIHDVNSAIVTKNFYSSIRAGMSLDSSFYNARLHLYRNLKYEHPSYWLYNRLYVSGFAGN